MKATQVFLVGAVLLIVATGVQAALPYPGVAPATVITDTSAAIHGIIYDDGGWPCQARFTYWQEGGNPIHTTWHNVRPASPPQPPFPVKIHYTLEGLAPGMMYYYTFSVDNADGTRTATKKPFTTRTRLTIDSTVAGSVVVPGEGVFTPVVGDLVSLTAVPEAGYTFVTWSGSAVDAGLVTDTKAVTTTLRAAGNHTLRANFVTQYTVSSGPGGSVVVPGEGDFSSFAGAEVLLVAAAEPNKAFISWTGSAVDANLVANVNSANTTMTVMPGMGVKANFIFPVLASPVCGATDVPLTVTLEWFDLYRAIGEEVYLSADCGSAPKDDPRNLVAVTDPNDPIDPNTLPSVDVVVAPGTYCWQVTEGGLASYVCTFTAVDPNTQ
ncbi:hypothetical protein ACFL6U_11165 [Planctomycetota bacterium]